MRFERKILLRKKIKKVFKNAVFPSHLGLHAAVAKDAWINDKQVLQKITREKDFNGHWWNIPDSHLDECRSLALNYLDSIGMYFYIPAYMLKAIKDIDAVKNTAFFDLTITLDPSIAIDDKEQYSYFCKRLKLFNSKEKKVCLEFFSFMIYSSEQKYPNIAKNLTPILESEFWNT